MASAATLPPFARLPAEIHRNILSRFCHHCWDPDMEEGYHDYSEFIELWTNRKTLSSLSKTCRRLRSLAQPILHHHLPMRQQPNAERLYQFVRTITQRGDLASAVRVIELDVHSWYYSCYTMPPSFGGSLGLVTDVQEVAGMEEALRQSGLEPRDGWHFETNSEPPSDIDYPWTDKHTRLFLDDEACFLLAQLAFRCSTNTSLVDFGEHLEYSGPWLSRPGVHASFPLPRNTECVRIRGERWPGRNGTGYPANLGPAGDMANLARLTDYLPSLKTLQLKLCSFRRDFRNGKDAEDEPTPLAMPPGLDLSNIRCLHLTLCTLTRGRLAQLLENCTSLTDFAYIGIVDREARQSSSMRPVDPLEVTDIIQHRCPHLHKNLRSLRLEHHIDLDYGYRSVYGPVNKLAALRAVNLGAYGLFCFPAGDQAIVFPLADTLPPNIESLAIVEAREWPWETSRALIHLLEDILTGEFRFDMLRTISVSFSPEFNWLVYGSVTTLKYELGQKWWLSVDNKARAGVVPELDPRVAELAAEAGIELVVEEITVNKQEGSGET